MNGQASINQNHFDFYAAGHGANIPPAALPLILPMPMRQINLVCHFEGIPPKPIIVDLTKGITAPRVDAIMADHKRLLTEATELGPIAVGGEISKETAAAIADLATRVEPKPAVVLPFFDSAATGFTAVRLWSAADKADIYYAEADGTLHTSL